MEKEKASRLMTYVSDGRTQESAQGLTIANISTLPTKKVLFHKKINVQLGLNGISGPTVRGARGAPSNEDVEIVQHPKHADHQQMRRRSA